jgi:hypothetical protein
MDNIKRYLLENKLSLDTDIPDEENWSRLSRKFGELDRARKVRVRGLFRIGMAASLLLAVGGFVIWRMNGTSRPSVATQETVVSPAGTDPQAQAVSSMYSPAIYRELSALGKTSFYGHDRGVFKVFSDQWKDLEANEKAIEQNMRSVGPSDRSIQQLTENYKLKIRLLQQFAIEIKKVKNYLPAADTLSKIPSLSLLNLKTPNDEEK